MLASRLQIFCGVLGLGLMLEACSPVSFSPVGVAEAPRDALGEPPLTPIDPELPPPAKPPEPPTPPLPPPPVPPGPTYEKTQGVCADDGSTRLSSCMNCVVPHVQLPPQLSRKGYELWRTMTKGCAVANKSDPAGYRAPTSDELLLRLRQCSPTLYPDTTYKYGQEATITGLAGDNQALRNKVFSGLFYRPPYSEHFTTYFGLDVAEARYLFCYNDAYLPPNVYPIEYYSSPDPSQFRMPALYIEANRIRRTLKNCMAISETTPYVPPVPPPPVQCRYETMSGPNGLAVTQQVAEWIKNGFTVGYESASEKMCGTLKGPGDLAVIQGHVSVVAFRCDK